VVLGTSHHEPMGRAHVEWERYGAGAVGLHQEPRKAAGLLARGRQAPGRQREPGHGRHARRRRRADEQGTATQLLETIVADQRKIIGEVTGKDPRSETPQVWALYKEVQDYYDAGMRVPDDVTLLFSPTTTGATSAGCRSRARPAPGGYGVYYHFDYVGGPRNYKWLNTNQIERTWEQMKLARDARRRPAVDRQCRRPQADGAADRVLPRHGLGPGRP
jgi:hypothetical protein